VVEPTIIRRFSPPTGAFGTAPATGLALAAEIGFTACHRHKEKAPAITKTIAAQAIAGRVSQLRRAGIPLALAGIPLGLAGISVSAAGVSHLNSAV
jgi:hypothetical protein